MAKPAMTSERRTSVDDVFECLQTQIATLKLKPGDRLSEAEVASQFGITHQPVRDAFSRLAKLDLLLIRPQRVTEVKRFSTRNIEKARFIRTAIEKEVLARAAALCDAPGAARLDQSIADQNNVVARGDIDAFGPLDYQFHITLCDVAQADFAFDVILAKKAKVDRICMLGHDKEQRIPDLVDDNCAIAEAAKRHDGPAAVAMGMDHLSRLDKTIDRIQASNAEFFD